MPIRSDQTMQNLWKATGFLTLSKHTQTLNKIPNHTATTEMQPQTSIDRNGNDETRK